MTKKEEEEDSCFPTFRINLYPFSRFHFALDFVQFHFSEIIKVHLSIQCSLKGDTKKGLFLKNVAKILFFPGH